ncbi:MAG: TIGR01841 family phasin [Burkholderiales bacterium]|nr:TIGR01841 family phasin [Burkholderiales bacterium]
MINNLNAEQFLAANKNAVAEAQALASTAFAGFEKLVALNMAVTKTALLQTTPDYLAAFSAANPTDALAAQASLVKPLVEQTISYGRSVYEIASQTAAELTSVAEEKFALGQEALAAAVDSMAKNAPAGSESAVAMFKSAMAAGQSAIDTAKSSAKKAVELAEKQATAVTETALSSVKTTSRKK